MSGKLPLAFLLAAGTLAGALGIAKPASARCYRHHRRHHTYRRAYYPTYASYGYAPSYAYAYDSGYYPVRTRRCYRRVERVVYDDGYGYGYGRPAYASYRRRHRCYHRRPERVVIRRTVYEY